MCNNVEQLRKKMEKYSKKEIEEAFLYFALKVWEGLDKISDIQCDIEDMKLLPSPKESSDSIDKETKNVD